MNMKRITSIIAVFALLALSACSTVTTTDPATGVTTTTVDVSKNDLAVATHADLLAAAKYAQDNGYPARAAVWLAEDTKLTAIEAQISACANAIRANLPKEPSGGDQAGPFTKVEMLTEAAGNFVGLAPNVKIACAAMPVVIMPILPKP